MNQKTKPRRVGRGSNGKNGRADNCPNYNPNHITIQVFGTFDHESKNAVVALRSELSPKNSFPKLPPRTLADLRKFLDDLDSAPFHCRVYNNSLPELLREVLRIIQEDSP